MLYHSGHLAQRCLAGSVLAAASCVSARPSAIHFSFIVLVCPARSDFLSFVVGPAAHALAKTPALWECTVGYL